MENLITTSLQEKLMALNINSKWNFKAKPPIQSHGRLEPHVPVLAEHGDAEVAEVVVHVTLAEQGVARLLAIEGTTATAHVALLRHTATARHIAHAVDHNGLGQTIHRLQNS